VSAFRGVVTLIELWELADQPSKPSDYHWYSDDLPARKFYLFIAEIGRRLRELMTKPESLRIIDLCEQCAEGLISEDEISALAPAHRVGGTAGLAHDEANGLYWWVADRYKVAAEGVDEAVDAFALLTAVQAGAISERPSYDEMAAVRWHPAYASVRERTELEWSALVRDIYGPNPFRPVAFDPAWRTDTVASLARQMYEARDFATMPILADALQDAGCDRPDVLAHCRGDGPHARGCWVVDLVLGKS
jgi:hypothetical protein